MISRTFLRRYLLTVFAVLTAFALLAGAYQINAAARAVMSENAVPMPSISGDGVIESVFSGYGLSCFRSAAGKVCPYIALVVEVLLWVFFAIVSVGS